MKGRLNEICERITIDLIGCPKWFYYLGSTILIETALFDELYSVTENLFSACQYSKKAITNSFMNNSDYPASHTQIIASCQFRNNLITIMQWSMNIKILLLEKIT